MYFVHIPSVVPSPPHVLFLHGCPIVSHHRFICHTYTTELSAHFPLNSVLLASNFPLLFGRRLLRNLICLLFRGLRCIRTYLTKSCLYTLWCFFLFSFLFSSWLCGSSTWHDLDASTTTISLDGFHCQCASYLLPYPRCAKVRLPVYQPLGLPTGSPWMWAPTSTTVYLMTRTNPFVESS